MRRLSILLVVAVLTGVVAVGLAIAAPDNNTPVTMYGQTPDGGRAPSSVDAIGRSRVIVEAAPDGGLPVSGTVAVTAPLAGLPVTLGTTGTAESPLRTDPTGTTTQPVELAEGAGTIPTAPTYVAPVDALGNQTGTAANPLPTRSHTVPLRVSTDCLFLVLPSADPIVPVADHRYRMMARSGYVCPKVGSAPASCQGVPMFAPDSPEEVVFAPTADGGDPSLYFFTASASAGIELCPLDEVP